MVHLYHATTSELALGKKLQAGVSDLGNLTQLRRDAEEILERKRPSGLPSRLSSWFACDKPVLAAKYLDAELGFGSKRGATAGRRRLYKVETLNASAHPMALVNEIALCVSKGKTSTAEALAVEYWTPNQTWRFLEYLAPEIEVVEELSWPDSIELALAFGAYSQDKKTLESFIAAQNV